MHKKCPANLGWASVYLEVSKQFLLKIENVTAVHCHNTPENTTRLFKMQKL
jgi:hypothetical protein